MSERRGLHLPDQFRQKMELLKKVELPKRAELLKKVRDFLEAKTPFKRKKEKISITIKPAGDVRASMPPVERSFPAEARPSVGRTPLVRVRDLDTLAASIASRRAASTEVRPVDYEKMQVEQYVRALADNLTLDTTGHLEGIESRLSEGQLKQKFQKGDIVFPGFYENGHWAGAVLAFNEREGEIVVMDSFMQQMRETTIRVNGKDQIIGPGSFLRTIKLKNNHFLVFNQTVEGSMLTKQIEARAGTGLSPHPYSIASDLYERLDGGPNSLALRADEGVGVRTAFNRALYGDDVDLSEILPHLDRIPLQRNFHLCGAHTVISTALAQIALEALFIHKVRTKKKTFIDFVSQFRAVQTYKKRLTSAENLLLDYVPEIYKKTKTPALVEQERRKLRQMVIKLFPSPGVKAGIEAIG